MQGNQRFIYQSVILAAALFIAAPTSAGDKAVQNGDPAVSGFGDSYFSNSGHPGFSDPPLNNIMAYDEMLDPSALDNIEPAAGQDTEKALDRPFSQKENSASDKKALSPE